eukprot:snap_masked-scaffold_33-processed-gene-0.22-mRNA-1 protein AED:0.09 eAED:0.12 QI:0/0/0/1/1/1/2/0/551
MRIKKFLFHPEKGISIGWDLAIFGLVCYVTVTTPLRMSFFPNLDASSNLFWIDLVIDFIFLLDIVKRFRTGYFQDTITSEVVMDTKLIAIRYLKGWFLIDFLSCMPVDIVLLLAADHVTDQDSGSSFLGVKRLLKILRVARLAKLFKLVRLLRASRLVKDLERKYDITPSPVLKQAVFLFLAIVVITHLICCAWVFMVTEEGTDSSEKNWVEKTNTTFDVGKLYSTSFYWASSTLTSVGFGDVVPANSSERIFASIVAFIGAFLLGYVFSSTTSMLSSLNKTANNYQEQMEKIKAYLQYRNVPTKLSKRIIEYFRYYISKHALFDEQKILESLSYPLRVELTSFLFEDVLTLIPLFSSIDDSAFLSNILVQLKPFSAAPGDVIMHENDIVQEMYFLIQGELKGYKSKQPDFLKSFAAGDHFGSFASFDPVTKRRTMTITAITYCDLFSLSKKDMRTILHEYPEMKDKLGTDILGEILVSTDKLVETETQNTQETDEDTYATLTKEQYEILMTQADDENWEVEKLKNENEQLILKISELRLTVEKLAERDTD